MKAFIAFAFLGLLVLRTHGGEPAWSEPVNGLRGRLSVEPPEKDSRFCRVFLEFQNVQDVLGQKTVRFSPDKLKLQVQDRDGKIRKPDLAVIYDGMSPHWEPLLLPYAGTLRFQISFPGAGYDPAQKGLIVDMGPENVWTLPVKGDCYLSGTFTCSREEGAHPLMDWHGSLNLPGALIPQPAK
jgi:hypothetical protein